MPDKKPAKKALGKKDMKKTKGGMGMPAAQPSRPVQGAPPDPFKVAFGQGTPPDPI